MSSLPIVTINSWGKRATSRAKVATLLFGLCVACGGSSAARDSAPPGVSTLALDPAIDFAFDSLDGRPVTSTATRGKPTVMAFVTTDSLPAQAQVDFLAAMAKRDLGRVNYAVVALAADRELVELYTKSLALTFPVAVIDPGKASETTAFGDLSLVPVTVVLDRRGHMIWRAQARVVRADEIRGALRGL